MATLTNATTLPSSNIIKLQKQSPLDFRLLAANRNAMLNNIRHPYIGLVVYVIDERKSYRLINDVDIVYNTTLPATVIGDWQEITETLFGSKLRVINGKLQLLNINGAIISEIPFTGGSGGSSDFDGNRAITAAISGLQGVTPGGTTTTEFLENVFYPALPPAAALSLDNQTREFGSGNSIRLYWNVVKRTNPITAITVNNIAQDITLTSGTVDTTTANNTNSSYSMTVVAGNFTISTSTAVYFKYKNYNFVNSQNLITGISDADLSAIVRSGNNNFADGRNGDYNLSPSNNQYIYFAYPASFGDASFVVNNLPNTDWVKRTFQFTNSFGYTTSYVLYRSGNPLNTTFSISVR